MITPTAIRINACIYMIFFALLSGCEKADTQKAVAVDTQKAVVTDTQKAVVAEPQQAVVVDAEQALKAKLIADARKQAAAHNEHGVRYAGQQNYRKAIKEFRKAVELDKLNPEYIYHLALSLSYQKNTRDEAVAVHLKAIALTLDNPKLLVLNHYNLACTYALQGKKDKAFEHLEKLVTFDARSQFHLAQSDKDFDSIRNTPRFKHILAKMAKGGKPGEPGKPGESAKPGEPGK